MPATRLPFSAKSYDFVEYASCHNFIGGELRPAASGETLAVENPRHAKVMGKVAMSGAADVAAAVASATAAFAKWRTVPVKERAQVFHRLKSLMERDLAELAWLVSHENGKTYAEAEADVLKGIECVEFGASLPSLVGGAKLEVSRGVTCEVSYEPLGVVGGVTPFNFPVMVPLWMLPQAVVGGNAFVLKPSEQVPYGAMKIALLLREAGLPDGVVNVVNGGRPAVEAVVDHKDVVAFAFVGSTTVAKALYARAAAHGKRVLCLGSAKNHLIIAPDADVEMTAQNVVASSFGCAGQRCMASSLVVAVGDVDRIIEAIAAHARRIQLGAGMGSIINEASVLRISRAIDQAEAGGAKVLLDGRGAKVAGAPGYWVGPTVLDHLRPEMPAACEEIFGPVLSIVRVPTLEAAITLQNSSRYGNGAAVYTSSGAVARHVAAKLTAGMVGINVGVPVPREPFSFGGWKDSKFGHGDITGLDGFRFWTAPRKLTSKWELQPDANWMS
ncbi:MAG: CoA-acylating methylmalonate-semialdehyde dehydrogenase [Deltaproteobacteria bacterium]|nr:CoA-acylating methylmalonate-semialdehyde dehydrogenase [Deltaproteobacteria bacterium]